jgi:uncharacterized protein involved in exopolysaccharide biosynthesis
LAGAWPASLAGSGRLRQASGQCGHEDLNVKEITPEDILSNEISSYEDLLAKSIQLKERVNETGEALTAAYSGIISAKHVFEEIKKENIEELRLYRQTVARECSEVTASIKQLKQAVDEKSLSSLREYVSLCERLKALQDSGFKFPLV